MTTLESILGSGSDLDRAEQNIFVREDDRELGLDTTALTPPAEPMRAVVDHAALPDRIDQAWITPDPHDDDDYTDNYALTHYPVHQGSGTEFG